MSVVGIDFGNLSILIAQAGKGGVDVILNESSNRQTATCVSIQGKQRFLGDSGAALARSNIANTISLVKLLVGRKYDSADVQRELAHCPFKTQRMPNGGVGISVMYKDSLLTVPAEQFMAMLLVKAKDVAAKANNNVNIAESVLAVPHWFTDAQRRAILSSCEIAKLNCLKVTNESNAIALSYGIFKSAKKLFSETEPVHIMFVDLGYTGTCVTICEFKQEHMAIKGTVCDRTISGRAFDDIIIEFLAEQFEAKTRINVRGNWKATLKMQVAAEKAKKTLSPSGVTEANVSVECLAEERDLSCILSKAEFESRTAGLVAGLEAVVARCLAQAGLSKDQISEVEIVGGSSRVGIVKQKLGAIMGLDPNALNNGLKTTMNSDEAVARGCALQAALLSTRMKVKTFNIVDRLPYGIVANFDAAQTSDLSESKEDVQVLGGKSAAIYSAGDEVPHKARRLTFQRKTSDFVISLSYDEESAASLPAGEDRLIGRYTIKVPANSDGKDIRVTFNIDKHGCVYIQSAQQMEEIVEPVTEAKDGEEAKSAEPPKKKYKKIDLEVVSEVFGLTREDIRVASDLEDAMAYEDRLIVETSDRRNELEAYIYSMRDKMDGVYKHFAKSAEKDAFKSLMLEAEDWLYGDGFDSVKQEYINKLASLQKLGNPIEFRFNDLENRPSAIEALKKQVEHCNSFASNHDEAHSHFTDDERQRVRQAASNAEKWLYDLLSAQGDLGKSDDPVLTCDGIAKKRQELFNTTNPIMIKPKPKPAPQPAPAPQEKTDAPENKDASKESKEPESAPMDEDKDTQSEEK